jgi:hypothetical protein
MILALLGCTCPKENSSRQADSRGDVMVTRILVAYDFSPGARAALERALELFPHSEVCLVHALGLPLDALTGDAPIIPPTDELLDASERALSTVAKAKLGTHPFHTCARLGVPADVVMEVAREWHLTCWWWEHTPRASWSVCFSGAPRTGSSNIPDSFPSSSFALRRDVERGCYTRFRSHAQPPTSPHRPA